MVTTAVLRECLKHVSKVSSGTGNCRILVRLLEHAWFDCSALGAVGRGYTAGGENCTEPAAHKCEQTIAGQFRHAILVLMVRTLRLPRGSISGVELGKV